MIPLQAIVCNFEFTPNVTMRLPGIGQPAGQQQVVGEMRPGPVASVLSGRRHCQAAS